MRRERDRVAAHNERMRLAANSINAVGLAFFGFGLVQPFVAQTLAWSPRVAAFVGLGLFLHAVSHYIVSQVDREVSE